MASSSVSNGMMAATGPKVSSLATSIESSAFRSTVGAKKLPPAEPLPPFTRSPPREPNPPPDAGGEVVGGHPEARVVGARSALFLVADRHEARHGPKGLLLGEELRAAGFRDPGRREEVAPRRTVAAVSPVPAEG